MKVIAALLVLIPLATAHMCMLNPAQRGSMMGINKPGICMCMCQSWLNLTLTDLQVLMTATWRSQLHVEAGTILVHQLRLSGTT